MSDMGDTLRENEEFCWGGVRGIEKEKGKKKKKDNCNKIIFFFPVKWSSFL